VTLFGGALLAEKSNPAAVFMAAALAASVLSRLAGGNGIGGQVSSIDATLRTATTGGT
jgi:hypothetical protein